MGILSNSCGKFESKNETDYSTLALLAVSSSAISTSSEYEELYTIDSTISANGISIDNSTITFAAGTGSSIRQTTTTTNSAVVGSGGRLYFDCPAGNWRGTGRTSSGTTFTFSVTVTSTTATWSNFSQNLNSITTNAFTRTPSRPALSRTVSSCSITASGSNFAWHSCTNYYGDIWGSSISCGTSSSIGSLSFTYKLNSGKKCQTLNSVGSCLIRSNSYNFAIESVYYASFYSFGTIGNTAISSARDTCTQLQSSYSTYGSDLTTTWFYSYRGSSEADSTFGVGFR